MNTDDVIDSGIAVGSDSLKLIKNSKGYNWEIKLIKIDIDHLEKINNEMMDRFGGAGE